jgi:hypothetical protein
MKTAVGNSKSWLFKDIGKGPPGQNLRQRAHVAANLCHTVTMACLSN